jgi:hypothetical protein
MASPVQLAKKRVQASAWKALASHYKTVSKMHLRELFAGDPKRGPRLAVEALGLYLDYSKNRVTDETLQLLVQLAQESGLRERIDAMFSGEKINITENRAVCTWPCVRRRAHLSWSTERMWCPRSTLCSTRWRPSPTAFAAASGRVTPASAFAMCQRRHRRL